MKPKLTRAFGYVITETPYNENWVSAIKHVVPREHRDFNGKSRIWTFNARYYVAVKHITEYFLGQAIDATGGMDGVTQARGWESKFEEWCVHEGKTVKQKKGKTPFEVLQIAENASESVIKAVARQLMKDHHPDNSGNAEKFKEVSDAIDKLKAMGKL